MHFVVFGKKSHLLLLKVCVICIRIHVYPHVIIALQCICLQGLLEVLRKIMNMSFKKTALIWNIKARLKPFPAHWQRTQFFLGIPFHFFVLFCLTYVYAFFIVTDKCCYKHYNCEISIQIRVTVIDIIYEFVRNRKIYIILFYSNIHRHFIK